MDSKARSAALATGNATSVSSQGKKSNAGGPASEAAAATSTAPSEVPGGSASKEDNSVITTCAPRTWYRVVFKPRVAVRSQPRLNAIVVASLSAGSVVEAVEVREGWVRLGEKDLRRSRVPETTAGWALVDGDQLGLGLLLQPCDETGAVAIQLQIHEAGGSECTLAAMTSWTTQETKRAIETATGISAAVQRLFVANDVELRKGMSLHAAAVAGTAVEQLEKGVLNLKLVRRSEEQAAWSLRLEAAGSMSGVELEQAPLDVRADCELVVEAVEQCGCALEHAAPAVQANRDVVLAAVRNDAAALRFADKELQADRMVLAAAVQQSCRVLQPSSSHASESPETALAYSVDRLWKTYKRITPWRTQKGVDKHWHRQKPLLLKPDSSGVQSSSICTGGVCPVAKPWIGFGGSFTEAAAVTLQRMSPDKQGQVLRAYFDEKEGVGYTLGRLPIGSCDFGLGTWSCGELQQNDKDLKGFSIKQYKGSILPMLKRAVDILGAPLTLVASPWSPPPWMKTVPAYGGNGHLRTDCRDVWAAHFVRFLQHMERAGVPIWAVSVQNEPAAAQQWESCVYTAKEECEFVRDFLGPALQAAGLESVKILIWDHNRDGMLERAVQAYCDPEVAKYVWGVAYHWYGDARFELWPERSAVAFEDRQNGGGPAGELRSRLCLENVRRVAELRTDKHVLQTESCQELGGRTLKSMLGDWKLAERYAMNIISDLNAGCEGWIDWNLCLDEAGGPNHASNFCVAPVICDLRLDEVQKQPCYWYLGHFSRFIRPGALRVLCGSSRDVLEATAFLNVDGSLVVVVLNQSEEAVDFWLKVGLAGAVHTEAPPRSITSYLAETAESSS